MRNGISPETTDGDTVPCQHSHSNSDCDLHNLGVMARRNDPSMPVRPRPWLGQNLKRIRAERGMSQRRLEELSGVARAVITRLEGGLQDDANLGTLEDLARALDSSVEELIAPQLGESEAAEIRDLIDEFAQQEAGEIDGREPMIYAQPEEIEWLRRLPSIVWKGCPPTLELLAGFVQGYRRRAK